MGRTTGSTGTLAYLYFSLRSAAARSSEIGLWQGELFDVRNPGYIGNMTFQFREIILPGGTYQVRPMVFGDTGQTLALQFAHTDILRHAA